MKRHLSFALAALVALMPIGASAASVLYENAWDTNVPQGTAYCTACGSIWRAADTFTLSSDADITAIEAELWIDQTTSINYSIWTEDLTTELYSRTFALADLYREGASIANNFVRASFSDLSLGAGTYALSIWDSADTNSTLGWYVTSPATGSSTQCQNANWTSCATRTDLTMRIVGGDQQLSPVPLPAGLPLLGLALGGLAFMRRRKAA